MLKKSMIQVKNNKTNSFVKRIATNLYENLIKIIIKTNWCKIIIKYNNLLFNFLLKNEINSEVSNKNITTEFILFQKMKIISINIGGDISKRVEDIKKFMKKEKPDIFCIMETHTFYEDYSKIKGWFESKEYRVYYNAVAQKEYYDKIK